MSDIEENTTPEIIDSDNNNSSDILLPRVSKYKYELAYNKFMDWKTSKEADSFSENIFVEYFEHLSQDLNMKPSSLWCIYSMIKSTVSLKNNVDISSYVKLKTHLRKKSERYTPQKAKALTSEQINDFILKAPDDKYLLTKVALVMGLAGACRRQELYNIKMENLQDLNSSLLVTLSDTKTSRTFTLTGRFYNVYKKYIAFRPPNYNESRFFLKLQGNKCFKQVVGINTFGKMPSQVAKFLKLPNPELYTGHTFRRSSATFLVDTHWDRFVNPKKTWGMAFLNSCRGYIDESVKNEIIIPNKIINSVCQMPSTSNRIIVNGNIPSSAGLPQITFNNCHNNSIIINYNINNSS